MDSAFLEQLGLTVRQENGVVEAELQIASAQAVNPLTRQFITTARFQLVGDRLIPIDPPELVGCAPINLAHTTDATNLEDTVVKQLVDHCTHLSRRSSELSSMGFTPRVDPTTLQLTADLSIGEMSITIGTDRLGNFRVMRAARQGGDLTVPGNQTFELAEFREKAALVTYLGALFGDDEGQSPKQATAVEQAIPFKELFAAFGPDASLPPRSTFEVLAELKVGKDRYRFAAARVTGRTFRGLLAGPSGKVWADRFELDEFHGVAALVAKVLDVPIEAVEVVA
jgi:hypothetical protein